MELLICTVVALIAIKWTLKKQESCVRTTLTATIGIAGSLFMAGVMTELIDYTVVGGTKALFGSTLSFLGAAVVGCIHVPPQKKIKVLN